MNRKDEVKQILRAMEDELEVMLDSDDLSELESEDLVALSYNVVTGNIENIISEPTLITPVQINKKQVLFALDEETFFPLSEEYVDDEDQI